jgi:1-phosphofructokinase family hexose kinase
MILTVTLNPAVDKTYTVENFRIDRINRASSCSVVAGGKGVNVSRVYTALGGKAISTGMVGGHNGTFITDSLSAESLQSDFVLIEGESRVCIKIMDPAQKTQTELNEIGPEISSDEVDRFRVKFESLVRGLEYVVICGSCPPGIPDDLYRDLIETARHYGVRCILDANDAPLAEGIKALPFMAKPNIHELSSLVGRPLSTIQEAAEVACGYVARGIEIMVVTLGRDGAIVCTEDGVWRARSPEIKFVSAVGSGDSFAAGFTRVLVEGGSAVEALKKGTAAGAANAMYCAAGFCTEDDISELSERVQVERLEG